MPHAENGSARIHYTEVGSGQPLLLVMGFGLSAEAWAPMLPLFSDYRVIMYDNRGTGDSTGPMDDLTIADFAEDAAAVLRAAGVERAHVHGQSMGGMIAQQLTLDHPELVHTLALGATSPAPIRFFPAEPQAVLDLYAGVALLASDPDRAMEMVMPAVFSAEYLRDNPGMREMYRQLATTGAPDAAAVEATLRAMGDMATGRAFDVSERLGEITVPVLVQHGSADRVVPVEAGRYIAEHVAAAEYQELAGAGHIYMMEQPMESLPRLIGFLAAHPLPAGSPATR
jgi:pimeloyl-ACP methyl ester carboxylesterase